MRKRVLKLVDRSFEVPLRDKDRRRLDRALAISAELRARRDATAALRRDAAAQATGVFRPGFADRVLVRLASTRDQQKSLEAFFTAFRTVFKRFVIVVVFALIVLLSFNLAAGSFLSKDEVFYVSDVTFERILELSLL